MANERMLTRVTNTAEARRLPYIPPVGREMQNGEQATVPGAIETMIHMGFDSDVQDEYIYDLLNSRINVTTEGFGGGGDEDEQAYTTVIGDGSETVFDIDAGFSTENARVYVYDTISGSLISTMQLSLQTPNSTSVRLTFSPAPASGQIRVFIFEAGAAGETYVSDPIGDGAETVFVFDLGFPAVTADIYIYDTAGGGPIIGSDIQRGTPSANAITVTFNPAPSLDQLQLLAFEGS
jgi:hypothetical protein